MLNEPTFIFNTLRKTSVAPENLPPETPQKTAESPKTLRDQLLDLNEILLLQLSRNPLSELKMLIEPISLPTLQLTHDYLIHAGKPGFPISDSIKILILYVCLFPSQVTDVDELKHTTPTIKMLRKKDFQRLNRLHQAVYDPDFRKPYHDIPEIMEACDTLDRLRFHEHIISQSDRSFSAPVSPCQGTTLFLPKYAEFIYRNLSCHAIIPQFTDYEIDGVPCARLRVDRLNQLKYHVEQRLQASKIAENLRETNAWEYFNAQLDTVKFKQPEFIPEHPVTGHSECKISYTRTTAWPSAPDQVALDEAPQEPSKRITLARHYLFAIPWTGDPPEQLIATILEHGPSSLISAKQPKTRWATLFGAICCCTAHRTSRAPSESSDPDSIESSSAFHSSRESP